VTLIGLLVFLIIVGVLLYIIQLIPMDATIKNIAYILVLVVVLLWLVQVLGGFAGLGDIRITR
jgi:hypothetical protein